MLFAAAWYTWVLNLVLLLVGILLILLILIQRGRGGGLIGALGGGGGSSPFGSRAGDTFTRITIGMAAVWIILNMVQGCLLRPESAQQQGQSISSP